MDVDVSGSTPGRTDNDLAPDGAHQVPAPQVPAEARRRPVSLTGLVLATVAAWWSVTPSLVPRSWYAQIITTAMCVAACYGVGALLGWLWRTLHLPTVNAARHRQAVRLLVPVAAVGVLVAGWFGRGWQADQHNVMGMDAAVPWLWLVAPVLGIVVGAVLVLVGRAVLWVGRRVISVLRRVLPDRLAAAIGVSLTAVVLWSLVTGVLTQTLVETADQIFAGRNDETKPGVVNPESPYRSGGPQSAVTWESLGREGRSFVWQGQDAVAIAEVTGDPDAVEPVRAFIGLEAADTAAERAQIAVEELRRLGGFDRTAIAVAGGTGSGWIDPKAAAALEFAAHGDVATVSMQYSYLPSWMSFLVDRERARSNAEELIVAVRVALDQLPPADRPQLYVYGESLGAYSTASAFTSVEDMSTTTDGALLIGPPSFVSVWQRVQAGREPGSPLWRPVYDGGALARTAATDDDLTDPALQWETDNRIVFLTHASDPIVGGWVSDRQAWLDPRGPGVLPQTIDVPIVTVIQWTVDQLGANETPPGFGHVYDEVVVTAWSEILGPPSLPASEVAAIQDAVADVRDPG